MQWTSNGVEDGRHAKCRGYDGREGDGGCEYGTIITCDECKYCGGRKDPAAKCNSAHHQVGRIGNERS